VPRKISWLNNVDGVYLVGYSLLPIGQQCLRVFYCLWHSLIGGKDLQIKRQLHGEITSTMVSSLREILQQANQFLNITQLNSNCD
jgi:hypothetical protein